jgi:hypothetical protein
MVVVVSARIHALEGTVSNDRWDDANRCATESRS